MAPHLRDSRKTARLVLTAVKNLKLEGGATLKHINNYIKEKFPQCQSSESYLKNVVNKAVAFGALKQNRNKYQLGAILDHIMEGRRRRRRSRSRGRKGGRRRRRRRRNL